MKMITTHTTGYSLLFILFMLIARSCIVNAKATFDHKDNAEFDRDVLLQDSDDEFGHDAISKLPLSEQKERLKELVEKKIDADKDGFISREELNGWTLQALNSFETEDASEEFPTVDSNNNGVVTWQEYTAHAYGEHFTEDTEEFQNPDNEEWKSFVQSYKTDKKIFQTVSSNYDAGLNILEYMIFKHPKMIPETSKIYIESILEKADLNGDGGIDLEEFLADYRKYANEEESDWAIVETDRFKEELDANKDDLLTGGEILKWMTTDNVEAAEEETDHLISECDTNGDSKLTIVEILNNPQLWIESDVTDYGRKLLQNHDEL